MGVRRIFRKRRFCLKYVFIFGLSSILIMMWTFAFKIDESIPVKLPSQRQKVSPAEYDQPHKAIPADFFDKPSVSVKNGSYKNPTGGGHNGMCFGQGQFELSNHADIYTYDLPEQTDYTMITGKRFREYAIPVKNEQVAYGPDLDPVTILLIPFSHVDPGYGRTIEEYYGAQTKHTLNNIVKKLEEYKDLTFQWAETVFLERWWRDITADTQERVRKLIRNGQLEIVLGGWVMPDEASTHYTAVVDQLVEGHQWLIENLETKPINSWSNDPFGFSSTMPYLWKKTGIENMIILRIHQAIKGTLMKKQAMEFTWKQLWSDREENSILCHLMAYRGYWIGDTCGPYNQHICREYAFMHTEPIHKVVFVTEENLEERARILYEQYRITAEIYRRHGLTEKQQGVELFVPMFLGEDFSYTNSRDFDLIYKHYNMLFDYINAKKEWRMKLKFGTMKEYFDMLRTYQNKRHGIDGNTFPSLAGDFFPYSDYQNDYWTGYYTTRPYNKQIARELQAVVRMADIFNSYAYAYSRQAPRVGEGVGVGDIEYEQFRSVSLTLRGARRELGMFLHHDGITGTSVIHVIQDFKQRLFSSLTKAKSVVKYIATQLLTSGKRKGEEGFKDVSDRGGKQASNKLMPIPSKAKGRLIVMNSSSKKRRDIVQFMSTDPVKMLGSNSENVLSIQLDGLDAGYLVSFPVEMPPFSIESFEFEAVDKAAIDNKMLGISDAAQSDSKFISIENTYIRADFSKDTGMLVCLTMLPSGDKIDFEMNLLAYQSGRSGAYIFAPAGEAETYLNGNPSISVIRGPLKSSIEVTYKGFSFTAVLYNTNGAQGTGLHISTMIDIKSIGGSNKEAIMRFKTNIDSSNRFFTDQNGFQLLGRKTLPARGIEENYYPITTMIMIEDSTRRLTLHTAQPHGGASLQSGWIEVMLDRCMSRDDDKGLGQGVNDNVPVEGYFVLQLERFAQKVTEKEVRYTFPSTGANLMNDIVDHPLYLLYRAQPNTNEEAAVWHKDFKPIQHPLPCTLEVVGIRSLVKNDLTYNSTSVILHKKSPVCLEDVGRLDCDQDPGRTDMTSLFPGMKFTDVRETSLSHLHSLGKLSASDEISPRDSELRAFTVDF